MSLFIASAHAQAAAAESPQGGELFQIGFLVLLFVLFYFIAIRPQRKRQRGTITSSPNFQPWSRRCGGCSSWRIPSPPPCIWKVLGIYFDVFVVFWGSFSKLLEETEVAIVVSLILYV